MSIRFLAWPLALFFALLLGGCGGKDVPQAALEAAVHIESTLRHKLDVCDPAVIQSAISQVAAGTLRSYAEGDLGPFARDIVRQLKKHSEGTA